MTKAYQPTWVIVDNDRFTPVRVHYIQASTAQEAIEEVLQETNSRRLELTGNSYSSPEGCYPGAEVLRRLHPTVAQLVRSDRVLTAIEYWQTPAQLSMEAT